MGQCSSCISDCLGIEKDDDRTRLLPSDYTNANYGASDGHRYGGARSDVDGGPGGVGVGGHGGRGEIDPQDQIREREALERIVTNASMNLIDIFAHAPQAGSGGPGMYQRKPVSASGHIFPPSHHLRNNPPLTSTANTTTSTTTTMTTITNPASNTTSTTTTLTSPQSTTTTPQPPTASTTNLTANNPATTTTTTGTATPTADTKKMALYRALLQKTSPPAPPVMPEILSPSVVTKEEREWLEEIGERAEEAVGCLVRVKGVGKVVVGLEIGAAEGR